MKQTSIGFLTALILSVPICALSQPDNDEIEVGDDSRVYDIKFLNENGPDFDGRRVTVQGYVRAGFDGHHTMCSIATVRTINKISQQMWLAAPACYTDDGYREGMAAATGVFVYSDEPFYLGPGIYPSQLKNAEINWIDE